MYYLSLLSLGWLISRCIVRVFQCSCTLPGGNFLSHFSVKWIHTRLFLIQSVYSTLVLVGMTRNSYGVFMDSTAFLAYLLCLWLVAFNGNFHYVWLKLQKVKNWCSESPNSSKNDVLGWRSTNPTIQKRHYLMSWEWDWALLGNSTFNSCSSSSFVSFSCSSDWVYHFSLLLGLLLLLSGLLILQL